MTRCGCYIDTLHLEADPSHTQNIIVYCPLHAAAYQTLTACKAALKLLTGTGQDGTLGHHPDNPVPAQLRAAVAAARLSGN